jgi:hypothetical protein
VRNWFDDYGDFVMYVFVVGLTFPLIPFFGLYKLWKVIRESHRTQK